VQYVTGGEPIVLTDDGAPERGRRLGGAGDRGNLKR
jgi:hypothetical protein